MQSGMQQLKTYDEYIRHQLVIYSHIQGRCISSCEGQWLHVLDTGQLVLRTWCNQGLNIGVDPVYILQSDLLGVGLEDDGFSSW